MKQYQTKSYKIKMCMTQNLHGSTSTQYAYTIQYKIIPNQTMHIPYQINQTKTFQTKPKISLKWK